jgi:hypothetical protein
MIELAIRALMPGPQFEGEWQMEISTGAIVVTVVSLALTALLGSLFGWQFIAMYVAGLAWALFDEGLVKRKAV